MCWRAHWIHPIHKRKSRADAKKYRGVHLTSQLSKVVERVIDTVLIPWVERGVLPGPNQHAYAERRNYKDTLIVNVCNWILSTEQLYVLRVYGSDVAGAAGRVECEKLGQKLRVSGLRLKLPPFL